MYILINYKGQIRNNPVGMVHNFPHYSTIMGSILAVYHKQNKTPAFPRVDMLKKAGEIGLEILYGYSTKMPSRVRKEMFLGTDYSTSYGSKKESILNFNKTLSTPISQNIYEGDYFILIKTDDESLIKGLQRYMLAIGTRTEIPVEYKILGFFESFEDVKKMQLDARWIVIKPISKHYQGLYLDEFVDQGDLESQGINPILFANPYTLEANYLCVVSQIKWEEIGKNSIQGVYLSFETRQFIEKKHLFSYNNLLENTEIKIKEFLGRS